MTPKEIELLKIDLDNLARDLHRKRIHLETQSASLESIEYNLSKIAESLNPMDEKEEAECDLKRKYKEWQTV